jgi:hypothetical protein
MKHYLAALLVLAPSIPRPLGACPFVQRNGGLWSARPIEGDTEGPTLFSAAYRVERPAEEGTFACGDSCTSGTYVVLHLSAQDDRSASEDIAYRFEIVGGTTPPGFEAEAYFTEVAFEPDPDIVDGIELGLYFSRSAGPFAFDMQIIAVDRNGNESEPIVLEIKG